MAFFSGLFTVAGAVNQIMKFVNWARSRLEQAVIYVAGYRRSEQAHKDAARDDLDDVDQGVHDANRMDRDSLIDSLAEPDDGVQHPEGLPGDTKAGSNGQHQV